MRTSAAAPPTGTVLDSPPHNLPLQPNPLLGRAAEQEAAQQQLLADDVRLLTLTGPPGIGKTRLALAVANERRDAFAHGTWFVDLASIRDPGLVLSAIAQVLGVREGGDRPLLALLHAYLAERQLLLVLDNVEQVVAAAPQMADLLAHCPGLKLLVTSRARLRLRWERTLPVLPLALPDAHAIQAIDALAQVPSVALFVARSRASHAAFTLTPDNARAVAALCAHLEGLPLAIELAAARANVLAPAEMLGWLEHRLPALSWEASDVPARQRSLRAAIAGSNDLLGPAEQALFRRLAVFAGGWTLEAAAAVTRLTELGLDPVDGMTRLMDASLVQRSQTEDAGPRFHLLETLREFAGEQLAVSGEQAGVQREHASYYLTLAEHAGSALEGPEQGVWFGRLQREHDNLRAALGWAAQHGEVEMELRVAGSLAYFWWWGGYLREGRAWLEDALARCSDQCDGPRLRALEGASLLAAHLGADAAAAARSEEALALARALGDRRSILGALGHLIRVAWLQGQFERLLPLQAELEAELEAARPAADPGHLSFALRSLGMLAYEAGDPAAATAYLKDALAECRRVGDQFGMVAALSVLAWLAHEQGDRAQAGVLVTEALQLAREQGPPLVVAWCAYTAVPMSAERAPAAVLAPLLGAVDALRHTVSLRVNASQEAWHDQVVAAVRAALGEQAFAAGWAKGRTMSLDQLAQDTLAALAASPSAQGERPAPTRTPRSEELLSPREREVLQLMAEGLTNRQIAETLVISRSTVSFHVTSLLNKLGADTRGQAIALAARRGLL